MSFTAPELHDARKVIQKHSEAGDQSAYAVHRAAELHAWETYRRTGDDHAARVALAIAEVYHNPTGK